MTQKEYCALSGLWSRIDYCYDARDEAWKDLQDLAVQCGYGSQPYTAARVRDYLMTSNNDGIRNKAMRLYNTYCVTTSLVDMANEVGQVFAELGVVVKGVDAGENK